MDDLFSQGFDKFGCKPPLFDEDTEVPTNAKSVYSDGVSPSLIGSGELTGNTTMVEGNMKSKNYVFGVSGWYMDSDGNLEANSGVFRTSLEIGATNANNLRINNNGMEFRDGSSNLRFGFALTDTPSWGDSLDMYVGNYASGQGIFWDNSDSSLTVRGNIVIQGGSGIQNFSDAGALASYDSVGSSLCDSTIISGGKIVTGLLTADNIQAGTLTGRTVKATGGSGADVWLKSDDGTLSFYYGGSRQGFLQGDPEGRAILSADNDLFLTANDDVAVFAGSTFFAFADAGIILSYNLNGGSDYLYILDNSDITAYFSDGGDLWVKDTISGQTVVDRTPFYDGKAIDDIRKIKGKNGEIDHDSLPSFVKKPRKRKNMSFNKETKKVDLIAEEDVLSRNIGACVSVLLKAVVELDDKINDIKKK